MPKTQIGCDKPGPKKETGLKLVMEGSGIVLQVNRQMIRNASHFNECIKSREKLRIGAISLGQPSILLVEPFSSWM